MVEALVLAGGLGRRLHPLTRRRPKAFIRLAGKMLYQYTLEMLDEVKHHLSRTILVVPRGTTGLIEQCPDWVSVAEQEGEGVEAALDTGLRGLGGDSEVIVSFTGYIAKPHSMIKLLLDYYSTSEYPLVMVVTPVSSGLETFGFARIGVKSNIETVTSTPGPEWMRGRGYVFAGALIGEGSFIRILAREGFIEGLKKLASRNLVGALTWTGEWVELGYPWDLLEAVKIILSRRATIIDEDAVVSRHAIVTGPVVVEEDAVIGEGAIVKGPAYIGRGASIGEGSIVGPNTLIESGASVDPLTVVRDSIVMEGAKVGAHSYIERCIIGESSTIKPQVVAEPTTPQTRLPWIREALEKSQEEYRIGCVTGPGTVIGEHSIVRGEFIE